MHWWIFWVSILVSYRVHHKMTEKGLALVVQTAWFQILHKMLRNVVHPWSEPKVCESALLGSTGTGQHVTGFLAKTRMSAQEVVKSMLFDPIPDHFNQNPTLRVLRIVGPQ